jgi:hypothetical protein
MKRELAVIEYELVTPRLGCQSTYLPDAGVGGRSSNEAGDLLLYAFDNLSIS